MMNRIGTNQNRLFDVLWRQTLTVMAVMTKIAHKAKNHSRQIVKD